MLCKQGWRKSSGPHSSPSFAQSAASRRAFGRRRRHRQHSTHRRAGHDQYSRIVQLHLPRPVDQRHQAFVQCKVDTGAQANAMSLATFNSLCRRPALKPTRLRVKPFGTKKPLTPCGIAALSVVYNGRRLGADFLVLDTPDPVLLDLEVCL